MTRAVLFRRSLVRLIASAVACSSVLLAAPAAHADTWSRADERRDVVQLKFSRDDLSFERTRRDHTTDITRVTVNHGTETIVIRVHVRDLTETSVRSLVALIKTPKGPRAVMIDTSNSGTVFRSDLAARAIRGCPRLRWTFGYATNLVRVVVPRRCLDNPRWVRVGIQMSTASRNYRKLALDDALSGRLRMRDLGDRPNLSRRIYR